MHTHTNTLACLGTCLFGEWFKVTKREKELDRHQGGLNRFPVINSHPFPAIGKQKLKAACIIPAHLSN